MRKEGSPLFAGARFASFEVVSVPKQNIHACVSMERKGPHHSPDPHESAFVIVAQIQSASLVEGEYNAKLTVNETFLTFGD